MSFKKYKIGLGQLDCQNRLYVQNLELILQVQNLRFLETRKEQKGKIWSICMFFPSHL